MSKRHDTVNHPKHYNQHPAGIECIDVVEHMNFNVGKAIKYLWRAGLKGKLLEDLKKARWYIDREILPWLRFGAGNARGWTQTRREGVVFWRTDTGLDAGRRPG